MPAMLLLRVILPVLSSVPVANSSSGGDDLLVAARRYERDYAAVAAHANIPSFSRQTGLPCSTCHTTFPQLTAFGRTFKMNGYTLTDSQVISEAETGKRETLRIDQFPPISAMVQTSLTQTSKAQPGTANGTAELPQQLSLFIGGAITPRMGTFIQLTYDPHSGTIGMDNADLRYANRTKLASKPLVYGFSLNNNPTVQDVWNTVPAWGYPYASSGVAPTPAAGTLLDGALGQQVAGLGAYGLLDNRVYGEFSVYRTAFQGGPSPQDATSTDAIHGVAPYWRAFYKVPMGQQTLMLGTLGMWASLYPAGITGLQDHYTDIGVDAQYERGLGGGTLTAHGVWIHEKQDLPADLSAGTAANPTNTLRTLRIDASVYTHSLVGLTAGFFSTTGTVDALRYPAAELSGSSSGSPDSQGYIAELSALPWQNTRFAIQYVAYSKFNGASHNYDGFGRNASDNNTLYLLSWVAF